MTQIRARVPIDLRREVRLGPVAVPVGLLYALGGAFIWLAVAGVLAGFDNMLAAFAANAIFIVGLFIVGSLTRTLGAVLIFRAFLLGAIAMAIMLFLGQTLGGLARDPSATVDPIAEEILKLTPLALLLWQGRRYAIWQLGATDIMLIAAAAGAGFAVVEDAYIRMNLGWGDTVPFLPTTEISGDRIRGDRLIAGHAIWTALSGMTIGIAWLMARIRVALALLPLGFLVAVTDHMGVNSRTLPLLGPVVIGLFLAGVVAVIAIDMWVLRQKLPAVPAIDEALSRTGPGVIRWQRILESRRLRYAAWRVPREARTKVGGAERALHGSVVRLVDRSA